MTFGLGTPGQVSFGYFYMKQDNQPDFGIPFVPIGNNAVPGVAGYGNKVAPVRLHQLLRAGRTRPRGHFHQHRADDHHV